MPIHAKKTGSWRFTRMCSTGACFERPVLQYDLGCKASLTHQSGRLVTDSLEH
jgi:hypothetical protein